MEPILTNSCRLGTIQHEGKLENHYYYRHSAILGQIPDLLSNNLCNRRG